MSMWSGRCDVVWVGGPADGEVSCCWGNPRYIMSQWRDQPYIRFPASEGIILLLPLQRSDMLPEKEGGLIQDIWMYLLDPAQVPDLTLKAFLYTNAFVP